MYLEENKMSKEFKKELKKKIKDYKNVSLYCTPEATVNTWCTDWESNSNTTRISDTGTQRCN